MTEQAFVWKDQKKLRMGYTTGSCAAAAAKAAARMLFLGEEIRQVSLMTPKGIRLYLDVEDILRTKDKVRCAIRKDAGDDPDVTDQILVYAEVSKTKGKQITLDGGVGVGRITRKGLEQPIGSPAINKVPQAMIRKELEALCQKQNYPGGLVVTISVPKGQEIAGKTFNPRLGIQGGISILGTSGIVERMSEAALIKSIQVEMRQKVENGAEYLLITPGNYGAAYVKEHMELPFEENIKCSNYVGETLDMAVDMGVRGILFVSHIGKFVKVAAGIMNTHSHSADGRMEVLAAGAIQMP